MNRAVLGSVALAVGLSLAAAPPAAADDEGLSFRLDRGAPTEAARNAPVDARVGNLTSRPSGLPGTGARRLTTAKVRQDLLADRVSGTFVLDAAPTESTRSYLRVSFGHLDGNNCQADIEKNSDTLTTTAGFSRSGRTITMNVSEPQAGYEDWNCAFAALDLDLDGNPSSVQSVLIGALTNVYAKPKLSLLKPEILGKKVKTVKLVRNAWHVVNVPVRNTGRVTARGVKVVGSGKGLKVKGARVGAVYDSFNPVAKLKVKAVRKKVGGLKLKVTAGNAPTARSKVRTKVVRAPKGPAPGKYRNKAGNLSFRVTAGKNPKVKGFRVRTRTRCGGYPDFPTYSTNWYDFPRTAIGGGGIVDRVQRKRLYTVSLRLKVVGGKVTSGRFSYGGPNRCFAVETFTAKRVGR